jgi:adenylate kinase
MVLLFIGPSGSGKDTQAQMLEEQYDFEVVSTGQLLRDISEGETKMQTAIKKSMNEGFLPDNLVYALLEMYLAGSDADKFILTGVVRRESQIEKLDNALLNVNKKLDRVVYFDLSDEEAVKRLGGRSVCRNCATNFHDIYNPEKVKVVCDKCGGELYKREDDNPDAIKERLKAFHLDNTEILEEYRERGILLTIDAGQTIEGIYQNLIKELGL